MKKTRKRSLWINITIISFIILLIFRVFNKPYFFGKNLPTNLSLIAQIISMVIILSIIFGLYFLRMWSWYLTLIDIGFGFINHLIVIIIYLTKPDIINQLLISQNITLNNLIFVLYPLLTLYWLFLAYKIYGDKKLF